MTRQARIAAALAAALNPTKLEIIDESDRHAGHSGARPGGETHYRLHIVSEAFVGKSRVAATSHGQCGAGGRIRLRTARLGDRRGVA